MSRSCEIARTDDEAAAAVDLAVVELHARVEILRQGVRLDGTAREIQRVDAVAERERHAPPRSRRVIEPMTLPTFQLRVVPLPGS